MRLAFLTYSLMGGGAERMVSRLANEIVKRQHKVYLFLFTKDNMVYPLDPKIKIIECRVPSNVQTKSLKGIINRIKIIHQNIKKEEIDILFAFMTPMIPFALFSSIGCKTKVIGAERANPEALARVYRFVIKYFSPFCSGYIFQTEGARKMYPRSISNRAVVIGNIAPECKKIKRESVSGILQLCTSARLNADKDFTTLFSALKKVYMHYPDFRMTIYGEGELKQSFIDLIQKKGMSENVKFAGFSHNIMSDLQKHDIFIFSSKSEGMPNALLEAMAAGLECIATECRFGPGELIEDGVNGWLTPVGDSDALAQKIMERLVDDGRHTKICENAQKVQYDYSSENIVSKYLAYATQIIG